MAQDRDKPVASQPDATEPDAAVSSLTDVSKRTKNIVGGSSASRKLKSFCKRWYSRISACNTHRLFVSLWSSFSFVGMGSAMVVFGPTLLDLASRLSSGVGPLAAMLAVRAIGHAVGGVGSGILFDKLHRLSYTFLVGIILTEIAITMVVPLSVHIAMLVVFMFFFGVATGALDNGAHAVLMRLWGEKVGPSMQLLHFAYALGAFFAPVISKPFLSEEVDGINSSNISFQLANLTCSDNWNGTLDFELAGSGELLDMYVYNRTDCMELVNRTCFVLTPGSNLTREELSSVIPDSLIDCSNMTTMSPLQRDLIRWPYWISASFFVLPLLAFAYYAIKFELMQCCTVRDISNSTPSSESIKKPTTKLPFVYKFITYSLLFFFMFLYVGLEASFGTLIFTASVKGKLNFSKPTAAVLTSVFWGTFAFMRLFSVILALLKVRASTMIAMNLSGSLLAATIMVFFPHNATAIWIGAAVLGSSYAAIYPTTMTWLGENIEASGRATSVLVTGGTLGDTILPAVVGAMIAQVSPDSLIYFTFCGVIVSAMIVTALFIAARVQKRRTLGLERHKYKQLEKSEVSEEEKENGEVALVDRGTTGDEECLLDAEETEL